MDRLPSAEGTDEAPGHGPESLHGAAPRQLVQQVDEDVDPLQEARALVGGGPQELRVNVLVGFEGHVFLHVTAGWTGNGTKQEEGT